MNLPETMRAWVLGDPDEIRLTTKPVPAPGRAEVLEEDASVRRAGLSGVPTFALNDHVLFAGAVPAETFAEALAKARRVMRYRASEITVS